VASADGVVNPEETSPYKVFTDLMSNNPDDTALVDICKMAVDRHERGGISEGLIDLMPTLMKTVF
jgi:hypothetical protein